MCLYSKIIQNKKYTPNKKNGGHVPSFSDDRVLYVPIGCGNCIECRKQKAREWQIRLLEEVKTAKNGKFITLTLSNKSLKQIHDKVQGYLNNELYTLINKKANCKGGATVKKELEKKIEKIKYKMVGYGLDNEIATHAMRLFLERWRRKFKTSLKHWTVTELGGNGTENIHIHGIVWTDKTMKDIEERWEYGHIWKGKLNIKTGRLENYVNAKTVNYIVKYISKQDEKHRTYKSKILTSAGIGNNYIKTHNSTKNKFNWTKTVETYKTDTGHKIAMPIYWRNKIYNEEEREILWLQKLDKEERWVMGEKVDISKGYEEYDKIIKYYRKKSIQFGYRDLTKNWEITEYERNRREIMIKTRIKKAGLRKKEMTPSG